VIRTVPTAILGRFLDGLMQDADAEFGRKEIFLTLREEDGRGALASGQD
jgi:hypothetical protein